MTYGIRLGYDLSHMSGPDFEVVILTGGASRRMGFDKSSLMIDGKRLVGKLIQECDSLDCPITVLGRFPEPGAAFLADKSDYSGPLANLRAFSPSKDFIFVLSCDIVLFNACNIPKLRDSILAYQAVIPVLEGFDQPLCAMYTNQAFSILFANENIIRVKDWTSLLHVKRIEEDDLNSLGIQPISCVGANTMEAFQRLISADRQ